MQAVLREPDARSPMAHRSSTEPPSTPSPKPMQYSPVGPNSTGLGIDRAWSPPSSKARRVSSMSPVRAELYPRESLINEPSPQRQLQAQRRSVAQPVMMERRASAVTSVFHFGDLPEAEPRRHRSSVVSLPTDLLEPSPPQRKPSSRGAPEHFGAALTLDEAYAFDVEHSQYSSSTGAARSFAPLPNSSHGKPPCT
jgi:hypothetical protein